MRETKRRILQFAFYDKTGIQTYLEKQAAQGWMLQKISYGWVFRRITPKKLHFFVTYFHKKSVFDADGSEEQKRFWEFCEHAGWKLAATNEQMQIFYNEAEEPVPIETDAVVEVEKIRRSAGKSFLLPYGMLLLLFLLQIGMRIERMRYNPLGILEDDTELLILFSWCLLGVYVFREIVGYFLWHRKAVRMAEAEGVFAPTKSVGKVWRIIPYAAVFCVVAGVALLGGNGMSHVFFVMLLMFTVFIALIAGVSRWMRRLGVRAVFKLLAVIVLTILVFLVMTQQLFMMLIRGELIPGKEAAETYEYNGWTYEVYHDSLPLTVEDLLEEESASFDEKYSYELTEKESIFLIRSEARQDPRADAGELPVLWYTVTEVKIPFLYDWCLEKIMELETGRENIGGELRVTEMRRIEEESWRADAAYRLYADGEAKGKYVVCYGNVILELTASWELTEGQMSIVGEKHGEL